MIYPIPPGLFCSASVVCALTGAPLDAVVLPALNRAAGRPTLHDDPGPFGVAEIEVALQNLGFRVLRFKKPLFGPGTRHPLAAWAKLWAEKPHPILVGVPEHVLALHQGRVYDSKIPVGCAAASHPDAARVVTYAAMVVRN